VINQALGFVDYSNDIEVTRSIAMLKGLVGQMIYFPNHHLPTLRTQVKPTFVHCLNTTIRKITLHDVAISSSAITARFYSKQADIFEMPLHKLQEVAREVLGQDTHSQWHLRHI
jgi:hypothetical protein